MEEDLQIGNFEATDFVSDPSDHSSQLSNQEHNDQTQSPNTSKDDLEFSINEPHTQQENQLITPSQKSPKATTPPSQLHLEQQDTQNTDSPNPPKESNREIQIQSSSPRSLLTHPDPKSTYAQKANKQMNVIGQKANTLFSSFKNKMQNMMGKKANPNEISQEDAQKEHQRKINLKIQKELRNKVKQNITEEKKKEDQYKKKKEFVKKRNKFFLIEEDNDTEDLETKKEAKKQSIPVRLRQDSNEEEKKEFPKKEMQKYKEEEEEGKVLITSSMGFQFHTLSKKKTHVYLDEWGNAYEILKPNKMFPDIFNQMKKRLALFKEGNMFIVEKLKSQEEMGFVHNIIELKRIFQLNIKKIIKKKKVEIILHLFNEKYDPFKAPVIKKYYLPMDNSKELIAELKLQIKLHSVNFVKLTED